MSRPARYFPGKRGPEVDSGSEDERDGSDEQRDDHDERDAQLVNDGDTRSGTSVKVEARREAFVRIQTEPAAPNAQPRTELRREPRPGPEVDEEDEEDDDDEDEESDESDESESDSEPETLARPVFVKRGNKASTGPRPGVLPGVVPGARPEVKDKSARVPSGRRETLRLMEETIRREKEENQQKFHRDDLQAIAEVDDTDDLDPEAELNAWKERELSRIRRDRKEIEDAEKEREEIERRRKLTDAEIAAEDADIREKQRKDKQSRSAGGYMQRYYHRGAFYQDEEILKRDFSEQVEDTYTDKRALPKALQVRGDIGVKGQNRHRTLAEEDTSLRPSDQIYPSKKRKGGSPRE